MALTRGKGEAALEPGPYILTLGRRYADSPRFNHVMFIMDLTGLNHIFF